MLSTIEKPIDEANDEIKKPELEKGKDPFQMLDDESKNIEGSKNNIKIVDDDGEMELLKDLKNKTDKDADQTTNVEQNADGTVKVTTVTNERKTVIHYANHELVAKLTVAALSVSMCMLLQFISNDWSEKAEKEYLLSPTKKAEILEPLTLVLEQSKAKYNPVVILVITVLLAYVPKFIQAFRERKEKLKLEESAKRKKKKLDSNKLSEETEEIEESEESEEAEELSENKKSAKVETKIITKEIFKMTKAQNDRIKKIKSKRGARSDDDKKFIEEMGLTGLI